MNEKYGLIYQPPEYTEPVVIPGTLAVKFSRDIFLMRSFLDQRNIPYKEEELEDGPFGKGIRIKRDE